MKDRRTKAQKLESANDKCKLLEKLGYEIIQGDWSSVIAGMGGIDFNFTNTFNDAESIIRETIRQSYDEGLINGEEIAQRKIKSALGISHE